MIKQLILLILLIILIVLNENFKEKFSIFEYDEDNLKNIYNENNIHYFKNAYLCSDYVDLVIK